MGQSDPVTRNPVPDGRAPGIVPEPSGATCPSGPGGAPRVVRSGSRRPSACAEPWPRAYRGASDWPGRSVAGFDWGGACRVTVAGDLWPHFRLGLVTVAGLQRAMNIRPLNCGRLPEPPRRGGSELVLPVVFPQRAGGRAPGASPVPWRLEPARRAKNS